MTTLFADLVKCANCGEAVTVTVMRSTNAFGSMDLDMRPPPMSRDTLSYQIHQCPACGLCSRDLADGDGLDLSQVGIPPYQAMLGDATFPGLARQFRACAHLASSAGNPALAFWATLRAAWVCDDGGERFRESAIACRELALAAMDATHEVGLTNCKDRTTDEILRLDLLRRSGSFQAVIKCAHRLREHPLPDILDRVAAFQAQQAERRETACFTVGAAL